MSIKYSLKSVGAVILAFLFISCQPKGIIPEPKMVDIITEMYITDVFIERGGHEFYGLHSRDSVTIYGPILAKHGFDMAIFRQSMLYYAQKNDGLQRIYAKVKTELENRKKEFQPAARIEELSQNFWTTSDSMTVNIDSAFRKIEFDVALKETGMYQISADVRFFENDSTIKPRMEVWLANANSDSIINKKELALKRDSISQTYSLDMLFADEEFNLMKGFWINYDTVHVKRVKLSVKELKARKKRMGKNYRDSIQGRQHFCLKNIRIKYNFEASELAKDTIKEIQGRKKVKRPRKTEASKPEQLQAQ